MRHRREYDIKLVGKNLRRLREEKNLSVEDVRAYLCLGSVQAIYKYEWGRNYPQADVLLALLELYEADYRDLVFEQLINCRFSREGCWILDTKNGAWPDLTLEVMMRHSPETCNKYKFRTRFPCRSAVPPADS